MMAPLKPLSIVHVLAPAGFGGLESMVATLAEGQAGSGEQVSIVPVLHERAADHPYVRSLRERDLEILPVEVAVRDYRGERRAISAILRERKADVLHTHGFRPDVVDAAVARELGVQSVSTVHGRTQKGWKAWLYSKVQERALRSFDAVVAVSSKLRGELLAAGISSSRLHCIPNCWRPRTPSFGRQEARASLNLPSNVPVVGWVGRLGREKAPDIMLRAFAACTNPELRLSLIGSGPLEGECRELAHSLGIEDRITWHGVITDVSRYLRAFDVVAITSWSEGSPMILLEAMAAQVPVVTTNVGGIPEMVSVSEALLVPAGDVASIAAAIDNTLTDRLGATTRALEAHRRIGTEFNVEEWVWRYRAIYQNGTGGLPRGQVSG
jgi:glycosyltransferase involved in cell wall biosynthesis